MQKRLLFLALFISLTTSNAFSMLNLREKFVEALRPESSEDIRIIKAVSQINKASPGIIHQTVMLLDRLFDNSEKEILNEELIKAIKANLNIILYVIPQYEHPDKNCCIVINQSLIEKLNHILDVVKNLPGYFQAIALFKER